MLVDEFWKSSREAELFAVASLGGLGGRPTVDGAFATFLSLTAGLDNVTEPLDGFPSVNRHQGVDGLPAVTRLGSGMEPVGGSGVDGLQAVARLGGIEPVCGSGVDRLPAVARLGSGLEPIDGWSGVQSMNDRSVAGGVEEPTGDDGA